MSPHATQYVCLCHVRYTGTRFEQYQRTKIVGLGRVKRETSGHFRSMTGFDVWFPRTKIDATTIKMSPPVYRSLNLGTDRKMAETMRSPESSVMTMRISASSSSSSSFYFFFSRVPLHVLKECINKNNSNEFSTRLLPLDLVLWAAGANRSPCRTTTGWLRAREHPLGRRPASLALHPQLHGPMPAPQAILARRHCRRPP